MAGRSAWSWLATGPVPRPRQRRVEAMTTDTTDDHDRHEQHPDHAPRNLMGETNPDTWDPDPVDRDGRPTVNTWDPIAGHAVDVPGHTADRDADMSEAHARRLALRGEFDDLDDDQPLPLLSSNMRTDPVEGTQGSFSNVKRLADPCPDCGSDYAVHVGHTLYGVHREHCLLCEAELVQP